MFSNILGLYSQGCTKKAHNCDILHLQHKAYIQRKHSTPTPALRIYTSSARHAHDIFHVWCHPYWPVYLSYGAIKNLTVFFQSLNKSLCFTWKKIHEALATTIMFVLPHTVYSLCFQPCFSTKQTTDTGVSNKHLKHHTIVVLYILS